MKQFLLVFSFLLKQNLSPKHFFNKIKDDKRQRNMFIFAFVAILLSLPSLGAFIYLYTKMYDVLEQINQASFFIVIAVMFSTMLIFLLGFYQITSYFYLSNEVKILTPLPIKTQHILMSKFFVIYIWELIINLFTVLPFFIIFGIKGNIDILAWINLLVSFILLPVIPLSIIGLLVVFIMKFTHIFKNKDAVRMIGMLVMLIGVVGIQVYFQRLAMSAPKGQEEEFYRNLFTNNQYLIEKISTYYPVIQLINHSIIGDTLLRLSSIIVYMLISIASVYIFGRVLQKVFLKSYLNEQEQINKKRKNNPVNQHNKRSVVFSIMLIDLKTLFRVPIFALNCLSTVILIPAIIIISIMSMGDLDIVSKLYDDNKYFFWLVCALALVVIGSLNMITSTTFSREGETNWIMRTLPINKKDHIMGRLSTAILVQFILTIISISIIFYLLKGEFFLGILTLLLVLIASLPIQLIGLFIDLKRPLLKWDNPQVAVKQNMNVIITLFISMIYAMVMVLIYKGLDRVFNIHNLTSFLLIYTLFIIINIMLGILIYHLIKKQFEESLVLME